MKTYYLIVITVVSFFGCTQEMYSTTKRAELDSSSVFVSSEESSAMSSESDERQLLDIDELYVLLDSIETLEKLEQKYPKNSRAYSREIESVEQSLQNMIVAVQQQQEFLIDNAEDALLDLKASDASDDEIEAAQEILDQILREQKQVNEIIEEASAKKVNVSSSSFIGESGEYSSGELGSSSENKSISSVTVEEESSQMSRNSSSLNLSQAVVLSSSYMSSSHLITISSSSAESSVAMSVSVDASSSSQPVQHFNTSPYFTQGSSLQYSLDEDTQIAFTLNAVDDENDTLNWFLDENVSGQIVLSNVGNVRSVTYTPSENFHGTEQIQIRIEDAELSFVLAISFEVLSVNDSAEYSIGPDISGIGSVYTINEGTCIDPDGVEQFTFNWFRDDDQSGLDGDSILNAHEKEYTLTSEDNEKYIYAQSICNAEDSLYTNYSDKIEINAPPIIAQGDTTKIVVGEGFNGTLSLTISATDPDLGTTLIWSIKKEPLHGSAILNSVIGNSPTVTYGVDVGYSGGDEIILQVSDGYLTDEIVVIISISPP